jgi:rhodanese-related sulfurtransferase/DNA-binding transcriptional ArsR family regulator
MSHRAFKDRLYPQFARVGAALASERRLELLDLLAQAPRHVEALASETGMSVANVSQHLQHLRSARLVEADREGTKVRYRLAGDDVLRLWLALRSVAETRLADVDQVVRAFAVDETAEPPLSRDALAGQVQRGEVVLIDVRPSLEYEHGHLPGAVSVPLEELPARLSELPRNKTIVAYCRGAYCLFADEAVALLCAHGFHARRLDGGWPEWYAEGRTVAAGSASSPSPRADWSEQQ